MTPFTFLVIFSALSRACSSWTVPVSVTSTPFLTDASKPAALDVRIVRQLLAHLVVNLVVAGVALSEQRHHQSEDQKKRKRSCDHISIKLHSGCRAPVG